MLVGILLHVMISIGSEIYRHIRDLRNQYLHLLTFLLIRLSHSHNTQYPFRKKTKMGVNENVIGSTMQFVNVVWSEQQLFI